MQVVRFISRVDRAKPEVEIFFRPMCYCVKAERSYV